MTRQKKGLFYLSLINYIKDNIEIINFNTFTHVLKVKNGKLRQWSNFYLKKDWWNRMTKKRSFILKFIIIILRVVLKYQTRNKPSQVTPSPVKPVRQAQVKLPNVFAQVALEGSSQLFSNGSEHSSASNLHLKFNKN